MILKNIKTEHKDEMTGMVVKRIITSEGEFLNHKLAVCNNIFNCEKNRLIFGKSIFTTPFHTHHISFNNKKKIWMLEGMEVSKEHAKNYERIYLTFQQRSEPQWETLTFKEAEGDFQNLATRGLSLVAYPIPINASLEEWKKRRDDAVSILNASQILVPIFCSKHQRELFEDVFNYEFEHSKMIGVQCYSLNDGITLLNLMKIRNRNMMLEIGDESPLLWGLNYQRVLKNFSYVSGSFAYTCFGFDVVSGRQTFLEKMPTEAVQKIINKNPDEIMRYDKTLGGFNLSAEQEFWDGINITRQFLESVKTSEGLSPYQAIQWANHKGQQEDLDILNSHILETAEEDKKDSAFKFVESGKEKWAVFWKTKISKSIESV
jgi:hypothetical protein